MKKAVFAIIFLGLLGCNNSPKPIIYGTEGCHYCSMTIVDKQHAAQFMTKKGRSYAFDASECMLNHLKEIDPSTVALFLVNDYESPGQFIDATKATYLISQNIPSPMGEFLTAFSNEEIARRFQKVNQGKVLSWQDLLEKFNNK